MMKLIKKKDGKKVVRFKIDGAVELDYNLVQYAMQHWKHWENPRIKTKSKEDKRLAFAKWVEAYVLLEGIGFLKNTCVGLEDLALEELRHNKIKKERNTTPIDDLLQRLAG